MLWSSTSREKRTGTNVSMENQNRTGRLHDRFGHMHNYTKKAFYRTVERCGKMEPEIQRKPSK